MSHDTHRHFFTILALTSIIAAIGAACGKEKTASSDPEELEGPPPTLPTSSNVERITQMLQTFSSDAMQGRLTGIASGDLAEQELIDTLETAGLEVDTQEVTFPLYEVGTPAALELLDNAGAPAEILDYFDEFREVDFSGSGSVTAPLIFVGYGLTQGSYDSYEGLDVSGKIVAMLTSVPSGQGFVEETHGRIDLKIDNAHQHGAVGVIFVLAGSDLNQSFQQSVEHELWALDEYQDLHPSLVHDDLPAAFVHVSATEKLLGQSAYELVADPSSFELSDPVHLEIHGTIHTQATCRNVFGIMHGTDSEVGQEVVVLGAHYDHLGMGADGEIFNGAADNASGTAVVLETAVALQSSGVTPKRTLLFAFWCAEEQGLRGSIEYAIYGSPLFPLADTVMMIQVDYLGAEDGPYIINVDDNPMILDFLGDSPHEIEMPVGLLDWHGRCASDDCPFLWRNIPAYRFISYGAHHHRPSDTFENLSIPIISRVADVTLHGLSTIAF